MIGIIDSRLKQEGYHYLKVQPEEAGVYYRFEQDRARVVIGVYAHDTIALSASQLGAMQRRVRELFLHPQGMIVDAPTDHIIVDVEILTLVVAPDIRKGRELCAGNQFTWLLDTSERRLIIYEDQPGDFHGLNHILQELIDSSAEPSVHEWTDKIFVRPNGTKRAVMNTTIVLINIVVFLVLTFLGDTNSAGFIAEHGGMYPEYVLEHGQWYRLFTAMFLHFGIDHLANNMVILFFVGDKLEDAVGRIRYLIIYILAGLGGSAFSLYTMMNTGDIAVSAGASGAIFGVIGALLWVAIIHRGHFENLTTRGLLFMILLCLYFGFTSSGVDNAGHVGGLLTGFVLCALLYRGKTRRSKHQKD